MKRVLCILAAAAALYPAALRGDSLIIAGGGFVGVWDTEIDLANPGTDPIDVSLSVHGLPLEGPCPPNCNGKTYTVPGNGTLLVLASDFLGETYAGPQMIRVDTAPAVGGPDHAPPIVHARAVSQASTCQFAELPVIHETTLQAMDPSVLIFPGAAHLPGVYSNLILERVGGLDSPAEVLIEVFDREGVRISGGGVLVVSEFTLQATTVVDVVGSLNAADLDGGQVRVTKMSGDGVLWGVLTTVGAEGSLRVSVGANP